ncbi:MAG TPA: hypothetical protein VFD46_04330 [Chryseolinea sp.]|nr:hypothetical protein [Chryseolinea sp.]
MIKVGGFKYHDTANLFFGFGKGPVSYGDFTVAPAYCGGIFGALQRFAPYKVTVLSQFIIVSEALIHHGFLFFFAS